SLLFLGRRVGTHSGVADRTDTERPAMSTPEDASESTEAAQPEPGAPAPARNKTLTTGIAFVAVAALAATAGALIAGSGSQADATDEPTDQIQGDTAEGTETAEILTTSFAVGEHRGFDDVHQGGEEDLENVLVSTDWLAERIDEGLEDNDIV